METRFEFRRQVTSGDVGMEQIGIGCIGFVFGYLLYYAVRHTEKFDVTLLSAAIGAVGSEVVITLISPSGKSGVGPYGIGLLAGFMFYLALTLYFTKTGGFDKLVKNWILFTSLLGVKPPDGPENQKKSE